MIIDASDSILGRLATFAAKKALLGEEVSVVNCEKALMTGSKSNIVEKLSKRNELGQPQQGPFFPKKANLFVRRVIRGMVPFKTARGKAAFGRVKCYTGVPDELSKEKAEKIREAAELASLNAKYISVGEICRIIGGKE
ncbi:50S ribosomal protein L13 [Candidatus Woesearchaeota archaeon]|nr:50S ribosomal protein L13 [Candidatus Woesearchaeota archaeon]